MKTQSLDHIEQQRRVATRQLQSLVQKARETGGKWPNDDSFAFFVGIIDAIANSLESISERIATLEESARLADGTE